MEGGAVTAEELSFEDVTVRVEKGAYTTAEAFVADLLQVVRNGKRIKKNDRQYGMAHRFEKWIWKAVRRVPHWGHIQPTDLESTEIA